jgi:nucleoid-associated protein YgaU
MRRVVGAPNDHTIQELNHPPAKGGNPTMGQLERYGLYVLVLVIFLILGVAIWGGDPASGTNPISASGTAMSVSGKPEAAGDNRSLSDLYRSQFVDSGDQFEDLPIAGGAKPAAERGARESSKGEPASSPATTPTPNPAVADGLYEMRDDTLWDVAVREYGDGTQWTRVQAANPELDPKRLRKGQRIVLPPRLADATSATSATSKPTETAARTHKVLEGQYPSTIAKMYYGDEKYADLIMKANGITDARKMRAGTVLTIPPRD